ncbi:MAG: PQQ-like beta-propeller repeat protein [Methanotrichaceae archaeon]|nr:PQQ-like beta-propeller repeat protein [Methanotrichaceae archaeon]
MRIKLVVEFATIILISMALIVPVLCNDFSDSNPQEGTEARWHQFHLNPGHTGASSSSAPRTGDTAWMRNITAQAGSSVSVAGGSVFVNCVDKIVSLDQFTGETLWSASFERNDDVCCSWHTPIYHDGKVFFTGMETVCLNATTGEEVWSFAPPTGRGAVDGSPAVFEGKVIVSDWDGHHYYCLEEMTGEEIWSFSVEGSAQSTPAISEGKAVFGGWEWGLGGYIYCADLEDGSEVWNVTTENSPCGSAAILEGNVYMTTYSFDGNGDLLALSLLDGSILWRREISPTDSTPTVAGGKVYVCGGCEGFSHPKTYCFDSASGDLIWETDEADKIGDWRCSMAYADGIVFVGKPDFEDFSGTFALDAGTGEVIWSQPEGGSSPAAADGMVYSVGKGSVCAFGDAATGGAIL